MKTLIVIPTYNEIDNIKKLIETVLGLVPHTVHVLVVDDGSPDGTGGLVDLLSTQHEGRVFVLHRPKKMGLGTAYVNGFRWGLSRDYEFLVEMDADFSHHPRYLSEMFKEASQNDVVIGSRYVSGGGTVNWGFFRKIISRGGSLYARLILGAEIRDFTGGFNGWKRKVLESVSLETLRSDGYSFQIELKYRAFLRKFKIKEFPIIFEDRKVGKSKMSKRIIFEALKRVWQFRFSKNQFLA